MKRIVFYLKKILHLSFILIQLSFSSYCIGRLRRKLNVCYVEIKLHEKKVFTKNKDIRQLDEMRKEAKEIERKIVAISDKYRKKMNDLRLKK